MSPASSRLFRCPAFVQHEGKRGRQIFRAGSHAFEMSKEEALWFREYSLAFLAAPRSDQDIRRSKKKGAPSPSEFVDWLKTSELNLNGTDSEQIPITQAEAAIQAGYDTWKYGAANSNFSDTFKTKAGCIAYLLEAAWFVGSAESYISVAASQAERHPTLRKVYNDLLKQEKTHLDLLLPDLDLSLAEFNQHEPAPAALALIAYLKDLARTSLPHFAIAYCMLEAEPLLARKTLEQIKATEKKTNLSLTGHAAHVKKDLSMAHRDLWRTTLRAFYPHEIRKSELNALFNSIHRMRHILIHWNDGIHFRAKEAVELSKILKTSSPRTLIRHPFSPNLTSSGARGRK